MSRKKKVKKIDKVIFLGVISGVVYFWVSKYEGKILYFGYTEYFLYLPIILIGLVLFRNFKEDNYDNFYVNWFFRFIMSLLFCYVPAMTTFVCLNNFYVKDKTAKMVSVPLEKTISRRTKNARILVKINGEVKSIYGYKRELNDVVKNNPSNYTVFIKYKEGLFNTYKVESYSIYKDYE